MNSKELKKMDEVADDDVDMDGSPDPFEVQEGGWPATQPGVDFEYLERRLKRWAGEWTHYGSLSLSAVPCTTALAAFRKAGLVDEETFDGLPGCSRLVRDALAIHPHARISGQIISGDRPKFLICRGVFIPTELRPSEIKQRIYELFAPGERPAEVALSTVAGRHMWELFWEGDCQETHFPEGRFGANSPEEDGNEEDRNGSKR
jgi:hypothetical protein